MARPFVVLFGYDSSLFTTKIRLCLKIKQIPYTFVAVPTMMPRPILRDNFNLTYRKIPVLSIGGKDLYCDTSLITEALEHLFPTLEGYQSLYPPAQDGRTSTCGLMGATNIWRTSFGVDRAQLIGHKLDPDKLEKKVPESLANLDTHLSMFEPLLAETDGPWIFSTSSPSLADLSLYAGLFWGSEVSAGAYDGNITGGELQNRTRENVIGQVFNEKRYAAIHAWYRRMATYLEGLPSVESKMESIEDLLDQMRTSPALGSKSLLLPTPRSTNPDLDVKTGLQKGATISVGPDDTGRNNPTIGTLLAMSPEEVVIQPEALEKPAAIQARVHFPRVGFVVRPVHQASL